jgi:hypothetical protein
MTKSEVTNAGVRPERHLRFPSGRHVSSPGAGAGVIHRHSAVTYRGIYQNTLWSL